MTALITAFVRWLGRDDSDVYSGPRALPIQKRVSSAVLPSLLDAHHSDIDP